MTFQPGDIIVCDCTGDRIMRRVVAVNSIGYIVETLKGNRRHTIPKACAEAFWEKAGGER